MQSPFQVQFIGATGTVTGSKYLVKYDRYKILIDCGLFQGIKNVRRRNWSELPFEASAIDAVLLTHAHIDHSGYLPALMKRGFHGPIYCSVATKALCKVLLPDAGYLQEEDARYANYKHFSKHEPAEPLYTEEDARKMWPTGINCAVMPPGRLRISSAATSLICFKTLRASSSVYKGSAGSCLEKCL